jgi:hypothetical protein
MLKRTIVLLALAATLAGVGASAPAAAQTAAAPTPVAQAEANLAASCAPSVMNPPANTFQIHNSFYCLGGWRRIGPYGPTSGSFCLNLTGFTSPDFPAPNGVSNIMSSGYNWTEHYLRFYDNFDCAGPILFGMGPFTWRDTLASTVNNKASSFELVNIPN